MQLKFVFPVVLTCLLLSAAVHAARPVSIAVVINPSEQQSQNLQELFIEETLALLEGEFEPEFDLIRADWSVEASNAALDTVYNNPKYDIVLVTGFLTNQLAIQRNEFPKPTFLPLVITPGLLGAPVAGDSSGKHNLNYLVDTIPLREDVLALRRLVPFTRVVLLTDQAMLDALAASAPAFVRQEVPDARISLVGHNGVDESFVAAIPDSTEAILIGGLPRLDNAQLSRLLTEFAQRGIPAFAINQAEVELGALASHGIETDNKRIARRTALNIQAVLLGEDAAEQKIYYDGKRALTINMQTAQLLDISPRFDVLSEARLINLPPAEGPLLDLITVANLALQQNLDLRVAGFDVDIGAQDVRSSRANLLPQLSVSANALSRDDSTTSVQSGGLPERSDDAALSLSQTLYSDPVASAYRQQRFLQEGREADLHTARLDAVLDATLAYLDALRADIQLQIQQDNLNLSQSNLELAQNRVEAGSASNADVFRWQSNVATARAELLAAQASQQQSREALNRLLNRPVDAPFQLIPARTATPFLMGEDEFNELVDNPRRFRRLADFSVLEGLRVAPELQVLQAQINAAERDYRSKQRALWLPDFTLQAQYSDNLNQSGVSAGGPTENESDWNVNLSASLPLFTGGALRAERSRARLLVQQLNIQHQATRERIEQNIRANLHATQASYANIELSRISAEAARNNLDLVADAYRLGTVSIVDLLDAQNQTLQAELSANNAVHNFLIDVMNMQRATGHFDFLAPTTEQQQLNQRMRDYINNPTTAEGTTP
ncbi:MAG: TolC family protein [Pseudomonadota bacterium]